MAFAKFNGINMHYEIQGKGPRLLFIHGITADLKNPISIFNSPLPQHFTVLAFDPRGLGETESPGLPGSIAEMADDAAGLAAALGWDKYHLFGASMGGMVAQELVLRHPSVVQKMVLTVTNAGGKYAGPGVAVINTMFDLPTVEMLRLSDTRQDEAWMAAHPDMVKLVEQNSRAIGEAIRSDPVLMRGYKNQAKAVAMHDTFDRLPQISVPTIVFGGKYDGGCPFELVQAMAQQITGARFELVESGHGGWFVDPEVWKKMIDFLQE